MSTASSLTPPSNPAPRIPRTPLTSLAAAAQRLTHEDVSKIARAKTASAVGAGVEDAGWQADAWDMYDLVGEQHFLASTMANRLAKARLYVGSVADDSSITDAPEELPTDIDDEPETSALNQMIRDLVDAIGGSQSGREQLLQRLAANLYIAGEGWLVAVTGRAAEALRRREEAGQPARTGSTANGARTVTPAAQLPVGAPGTWFSPEQDEDELLDDGDTFDDLTSATWSVHSVSEITSTNDGTVKLRLPSLGGDEVEVDPDDLTLLRIWEPHPRYWYLADSPTKSSLPILKELVGLTMHVSAQVQSRLAGAGLLVVPRSVVDAFRTGDGIEEEVPEDPSVTFTRVLINTMSTPISDRANASAYVPLVITAPDESTGKFEHLTFDKPLDAEARNLRDEALRRLALGQDCPPELLLGTGGMNHWGSWLVREDVVSTHLEPKLALICDALTTQYLWPALRDHFNMSEEEARRYVIWYDVQHLIVRPNMSADALELHSRRVINDRELRAYMGFDDPANPSDLPEPEHQASARAAVMQLITANPALLAAPGLDFLYGQMLKLSSGTLDPEAEAIAVPVATGAGGLREPSGSSPTSQTSPGPGFIPQTGNDAPAPPGPSPTPPGVGAPASPGGS